jgi:hypothetical protein
MPQTKSFCDFTIMGGKRMALAELYVLSLVVSISLKCVPLNILIKSYS